VSKEQQALALAKQAGWETIAEAEQTSESASIYFASRHCAGLGVKALLRIPIDIPLVQPSDIEALFDGLNAAPSAVIVPSGDGTGTNALLRTPPLLFPSRFGPNSFALHIEEARASGAPMRIVRNERIEQDVDEIDDLKRILRLVPPDSETGRWLAGHLAEIGSSPPSKAAAVSAD
jgi:2-phospho-L-lactate guanylyltransferase